MRILVTGAAGFLGSHLSAQLLESGHSVVGVDNMIGGEAENIPKEVEFYECDCSDHAAMLIRAKGCEIVYHCAALAYEGLSVFSPHLITRSVVDASASVFSAAIAGGVRRIIYCSSMARYGRGRVPFLETDAPVPQDPYGIAKLAAESLLSSICGTHGVEYSIAVPHNIIGPRQKYDDPYRNVASIMANLMLQGRRPVIYGDGMQRRCFSFIQDCIDPLVQMLDSSKVLGEVINIGPEDQFIAINELFQELCKLTGYQGSPIYLAGRPQEVRDANCSCVKARELLGYEPKTELSDGLRSIVEYIQQRGPREFRYHLPIEINSDILPETWRSQYF